MKNRYNNVGKNTHSWIPTGNLYEYKCSKCGLTKRNLYRTSTNAIYYRNNIEVKNEGCISK